MNQYSPLAILCLPLKRLKPHVSSRPSWVIRSFKHAGRCCMLCYQCHGTAVGLSEYSVIKEGPFPPDVHTRTFTTVIDFGRYPSSCSFLVIRFRWLDSVSVLRWKPTQLSPIDRASPYLRAREQHKTGYTGCFTTLGHNCRRWFPRSLWSKKFI
jgi:hypothetical protein